MKTFRELILTLSCAAFVVCGTQAYAQDFDPEDPDNFDDPSQLTAVDLAVSAFDAQVDEHCECDPDNTAPFEKCTGKWRKKALNAFKAAVKFNQESIQDLKSALNDEGENLNTECASQGDDGDDEGGDDDFGGGDGPPGDF